MLAGCACARMRIGYAAKERRIRPARLELVVVGFHQRLGSRARSPPGLHKQRLQRRRASSSFACSSSSASLTLQLTRPHAPTPTPHPRIANRQQTMDDDELYVYAKEIRAPVELVRQVKTLGRLPVVNFAAGA